MKSRALVVCAVVLASLTWWVRRDSPPGVNPARQFELYDVARYLGRTDNLTPRPFDPHRYPQQLAEYHDLPTSEAIFTKAYADGYAQHPEEPMRDDEADYDRAYRRGRLDRWSGKPAGSSAKGYMDGFEARPHSFERPY